MTREDFQKLPRHVAIIMDGNGRWAKQHRLNVAMGHRQGTETLREIIRHTDDGKKDSTAYSDHTGWKRKMGKSKGNAPELRTHSGSQECRDGMPGGT